MTQYIRLLFSLVVLYSCAPKEKLLSINDYSTFGQTIIDDLRGERYDKVSDLYNQGDTYDKILTIYKSFDSDPHAGKLRLIRTQLNIQFKEWVKAIFTNADSFRCELSKVYIENERPHIIVASKSSKGYNFTDFELKTVDNKTYIVDFYNYQFGDSFSNLFIENELSRVTGYHFGRPGYNQAMSELTNAQGFIREQDYEGAWRVFNRIEYEYQWGKSFQLTKLVITRHLSDSLYEETFIDLINTYYDEDKFRLMKSFQFYTEFHDLENAKLTLDSLTELTGDNFVTKELRQRLN